MALADLLRVDELSKSFDGQLVVDRVSFTLQAGSITGLIGPNGAGKSTLFHCLSGFYKPTSGRVLLDGRDVSVLEPHRRFHAGLGRTFQIPRPFPDMTVLENVMVAAPNQTGERFWNNWLRPAQVRSQETELKQQALHWLHFVGLSELSSRPARILSGGQRKLLELARAMMAKPKLVLLDEPGAGVNPSLLDRIVEKIAALNAEGATFLIIEHNMDLVASLCRTVMAMAQGQLLASGEPAAVLRDPRVVEAYLGTAE